MIQFLIEAATICLLGGLVGLILTYSATLVITQLLVKMNMSLPVMGLAVLVSIITGLASGFFPAWRAARFPQAPRDRARAAAWRAPRALQGADCLARRSREPADRR